MVTASDVRRGLTSLPGFVREYGLSGGVRRWSGIVYNRATSEVTGRSIFDEEWDLCVLLDACRADELERYRDEYEWLDTVGRFDSLASCTWNWVPRTVEHTPRDVLERTVYVSANPFVAELIEPGLFRDLDGVFGYAWDESHGTVYPRPVTDRAIHHWRTTRPDRLVVHYLQPHVPFLTGSAATLDRSNFSQETESVNDAWDRVTRGTLDRDTAIERYRQTLRTVLEDVDLLLSCIEADDVVVTADHGEAFGEWELYGHPGGVDLPCLTRVPWVRTSATRERDYEPTTDPTEGDKPAREAQLRALGYRE